MRSWIVFFLAVILFHHNDAFCSRVSPEPDPFDLPNHGRSRTADEIIHGPRVYYDDAEALHEQVIDPQNPSASGLSCRQGTCVCITIISVLSSIVGMFYLLA